MTTVLVKELVEKRRQMKELTEEIKTLERRLSEVYKNVINDAGNVRIEGKDYKVTLVYTSRLDTSRITTMFPPSHHPELYKNVLDPNKFKEIASQEQINEYSTTTTSWRVQ